MSIHMCANRESQRLCNSSAEEEKNRKKIMRHFTIIVYYMPLPCLSLSLSFTIVGELVMVISIRKCVQMFLYCNGQRETIVAWLWWVEEERERERNSSISIAATWCDCLSLNWKNCLLGYCEVKEAWVLW